MGATRPVLCKLLLAVASLVAERGLQGLRASVAVAPGLWYTGSVVVACGLSCSIACGNLSSPTRDLCYIVGSLLIILHIVVVCIC